jgi:uncharacterized protein (UPF0332 family)
LKLELHQIIITVLAHEFVQWVDSEKWLLILDSRALKHKHEVMRLGQVVHHSSQKMNMKIIKAKNKV